MPLVRRRKHSQPSHLNAFLRQYRFEIIWLAVVALGVFLVFERMQIRSNLMKWLRNTAAVLLRGVGRLDNLVADFLARTTVSDAIGFVLILGAFIAITLRMRWRLRHNPQYSTLKCPRCDSDIHRVHRTRSDHLISTFVPVRRYRCAKRECGWKGLRVTSSKTLPARKPTPAAGS